MLKFVKSFTAVFDGNNLFSCGRSNWHFRFAQCQKKELTDEQYFKNNFKGIIQSLPVVSKWVDDSHFILLKNGKNYLVDCNSGSQMEVPDTAKVITPAKPAAYYKNTDLYIKINGQEVQLTTDKDKESNPTMSPDGNYVAYTKNNDLYTININSKKETS